MTPNPVIPRGIRNNNPGNIDRNATKWKGMAVDQSRDQRFVVFDAPKWGIRALGKVLLTYFRERGLRTPMNIISRWAPPSENNTAAYAEQIAKALGVTAHSMIDLDKPEVLRKVVTAIIAHENGQQPYSEAVIQEGVAMALAYG